MGKEKVQRKVGLMALDCLMGRQKGQWKAGLMANEMVIHLDPW
jgi:hypothetical protein